MVNPPQLQDPSLSAIAGRAPNDIWVVGGDIPLDHGIMMRWTANGWQEIGTPSVFGEKLVGDVSFNAIAFQPSGRGWSVGIIAGIGSSPDLPLIEYWNGKYWQVNPIPRLDSSYAQLLDVGIQQDGMVWTVGTKGETGPAETLVMRGDLPCEEPLSNGAIPELVAPSNGAVLTATPKLDWRDVLVAQEYQVQLWRAKQKRHKIIDKKISASNLTLATLQKFRAGYRWRVRACNEAGCGPWSKAAQFTVK